MRRAFCEVSRSGGVHPPSGIIRQARTGRDEKSWRQASRMTDSAIISALRRGRHHNKHIVTSNPCVMLFYVIYVHVCTVWCAALQTRQPDFLTRAATLPCDDANVLRLYLVTRQQGKEEMVSKVVGIHICIS